jgi:hypothetical protein
MSTVRGIVEVSKNLTASWPQAMYFVYKLTIVAKHARLNM